VEPETEERPPEPKCTKRRNVVPTIFLRKGSLQEEVALCFCLGVSLSPQHWLLAGQRVSQGLAKHESSSQHGRIASTSVALHAGGQGLHVAPGDRAPRRRLLCACRVAAAMAVVDALRMVIDAKPKLYRTPVSIVIP
jgi:hypothetical protein